ncbi:MAG: NADH-quinone oxidoreductase subunit M [Candidatus Methanogranum gryphiswaldense]|nr:MAG: NADH-quinone oxidoreductase subunit M [Candidatus Methanogranum sp. U3.2.1]
MFDLPEIPYLLTLLVLIPLIGAIVALSMGGEKQKYAKTVSIIFSAITLVLAVYLMLSSDYGQYTENYTWIETAGLKMSYILTVDGLSILMVFLTALLLLVVSIFSSHQTDKPNYFFALLLAMEVGLMGVYMSADYFLFYIMWEVTLIPMYFMISWFGGPRRHYAAIKFFIYTHVASLVMLIGIFALAFQASQGGVVDFSFAAVLAGSVAFSATFQTLVFGLMFFGFAVKMPIVPFHTWLPDAHTEAPTAGSVLLAGVMLKMGSYGIIRVCLEALPDGAVTWQPIMFVVAIVAIIYGAYACIAQKDLKKMVAFSSISHMGMVMLGIACLSEIGLEFAIFLMFAHGLITAVLFMTCGLAHDLFETREIPLLGGLASKVPVYATFMMFGFMASLGLPGLVGFWGEFGIIFGFYEYAESVNMIWLIVFCLFSLLLTAGYYLWAMQRTLFGRLTKKLPGEVMEHMRDVNKTEGIAMGIMCLMIAIFGLWPDLALNIISQYSSALMGVI